VVIDNPRPAPQVLHMQQAQDASRGGAGAAGSAQDRAIANWLFAVAGMVFVMVVIGGLTRLTESGLSITNWRPVTGWLPPMSDASWEKLFAGYRQIPEYIELNAGMTLAEFKEIFWLEYIHRLWGRLIGVAFFVPFLWFAVRRRLDGPVFAGLAGLLLLGALQGGIGWYMVSSGLSERTDVSQYRLALHLGVAVAIYIALLRLGLWLRHGRPAARASGWRSALHGVLVLAFVTLVAGAFVAGTNAGMTYNTFPLMDGELIPSAIYDTEPGWLAAFEDITTIQFNHRLLATLTFAAVIGCWIAAARSSCKTTVCRPVGYVAAAALVQYLLGVSTLLTVVRIDLAVLHQAGALVLITALVMAVEAVSRQPESPGQIPGQIPGQGVS